MWNRDINNVQYYKRLSLLRPNLYVTVPYHKSFDPCLLDPVYSNQYPGHIQTCLIIVYRSCSQNGILEAVIQEEKCGALRTMPMITPPRVPAMGIVMIHERSKRLTRCQLTALKVPLQSPTPTVAPVIHMEVETGREYCEKTRTVMAAPISMEDPLLGEWYVILLPITIQESSQHAVFKSIGISSRTAYPS